MPVFQLDKTIAFPPPHMARQDGLLAIGGDLSPERLLLAYSLGIFPWYGPEQPILWWAPVPRLILEPAELKVSRRLARTIRKQPYEITFDNSFREVITQCAGMRYDAEGTWITREMIESYCRLHEMGYAHSVECRRHGELAGGLYGIALGKVFFGESMFSKNSDSSKIALVYLADRLQTWGFDFIDCQIPSDHLKRLGAREISGEVFFARLQHNVLLPGYNGAWQAHQALPALAMAK